MYLRSEELPDKRHSWAWSASGETGEKVGDDCFSLPRTPISHSVEVLDKEKEGFNLLIMGPEWQEQDPKYRRELLTPGSPPNDKTVPTTCSTIYMDISKQTEILQADPGELRNLLESTDQRHRKPIISKMTRIGNGGVSTFEDERRIKHGSRENVGLEVSRTLVMMCLIIAEAGVWGVIYRQLYENGRTNWASYVLLFLLLPTGVSASVWVFANCFNKNQSCAYFFSILFVLLISAPSPVFLYVMYLYELWRGGRNRLKVRRLLMLTQLCHALLCSLPLLLTNLLMTASAANANSDTVDFLKVGLHIEIYPASLICSLLSFLLLVLLVHSYNERRASYILTCLVTAPFTSLTVLTRVSAIVLIVTFQPTNWSWAMLGSMATANLVFVIGCRRKGGGSYRPNNQDWEELDLIVDCWGGSTCRSWFQRLPRMVASAVAGLVVPLGYDSDQDLGQDHVRGALLILTNYVVMMIGLSVGVYTAILYHIPNTYDGLRLVQPGVSVEIPETGLVVRAGGTDIEIKLPNTKLDLAGMNTLTATINTSPEIDQQIAIILPCILILISLPVTVMRIAMLGMDCVVVRNDVMDSNMEAGNLRTAVRGAGGMGVSARAGLTLCCGGLGAVVCTLLMLLGVAFLVIKFNQVF